jgi:hypothetical protein
MGGIYISQTVIQEIAFVFEDNYLREDGTSFKEKFIETVHNQPIMRPYLIKMPIRLVKSRILA